jgi:hypothetical protein
VRRSSQPRGTISSALIGDVQSNNLNLAQLASHKTVAAEQPTWLSAWREGREGQRETEKWEGKDGAAIADCERDPAQRTGV